MSLNPWHKGVVCALDFESTGVDARTERIVTACLLELHPGKDPVERQWLINPGIDIPEGASAIHGVTTERARAEGRDPLECLIELMDALVPIWQAGWPVVGHNLGGYDLTLLDHELHRHGLGGIQLFGGPGLVVDTLAIDKGLRKDVYGKGKRTLQACADAYEIRLDHAHDAKWDALAAYRIAWRMCERFPEALQVDLHLLMERQEWTHRRWADSFGAWIRGQGGVDDVIREWPYVPADLGQLARPA